MHNTERSTYRFPDQIPSEILSSIIHAILPFPLLVHRSKPDDKSPSYSQNLRRVSQVCRFWRDATIADVQLWTIISCELPGALVNLHITRARGAPLHMYVRSGQGQTWSQLALRHHTRTSARPLLINPERIARNLTTALTSGLQIHSLFAYWDLAKDLQARCGQILQAHPAAFHHLQTLHIFAFPRRVRDRHPQLSFAAQSIFSHTAELRTLELRRCSLEGLRVAQLNRLVHLNLFIDGQNSTPSHMFPDWRAFLETLSGHLQSFRLVSAAVDAAPLEISRGRQIHMRELKSVELSFKACTAFAAAILLGASAVVVLREQTRTPNSVIPFLNRHFVPLLQAPASPCIHQSDAVLQLDIKMDDEGGLGIGLIFAKTRVDYSCNESHDIPLEGLLGALELDIRDSVYSLEITGPPDGFRGDVLNMTSLGRLFPNVRSINVQAAFPGDGRHLLSAFLTSQLSDDTPDPPFPKLTELRLPRFEQSKLEDCNVEDLLLQMLCRRAEAGMPWAVLRLMTDCASLPIITIFERMRALMG